MRDPGWAGLISDMLLIPPPLYFHEYPLLHLLLTAFCTDLQRALTPHACDGTDNCPRVDRIHFLDGGVLELFDEQLEL